MKILSKIWRRLFLPSFAIYTFLTVAFTAFLTAASVTEKPALTLSSCFMLYGMSFLIAASSLIFYVSKLSLLMRTIINFFLTLLSVVISALIGNYETGVRSLILIIVFAVIYVIVVPIGILIYTLIKRKTSEDTEYSSMFGRND